jgi:GNAT superfamily N-acetyltransferase
MSLVTIARLTPTDRQDWEQLFQEWQQYLSGAISADVHDRTWRLLCDKTSGLIGLIARNKGGKGVGFAHSSLTPFAWAGGQVLYLQDLFVSETERGQGIGAGLLKAVYDLADETGSSQVFWLANEDDTELLRFYLRHAIRTRYVRFMRHDWPWFAPGTH